MSDTVIHTEGLSKHFGRTEAVRGIDLQVSRGAVYALLGLNGAGKSTTIRMLLGLLRPEAGSSRVLDLDPMKNSLEIKQRIGYVPESPRLYRWMTVKDFTWFVSGFYPDWDPAYAEEALRRFKIDGTKKIAALSKGMAAKVVLTVALAHRPELLVLDDPTSGLDVIVRREFLESIVSVIQEEGRTVFISTHQIDEVERVADHVGILHEGKLLWQSPLGELKGSVKRVRLIVDDGFKEPGEISGVLSRDRSERLWTGVVSGCDESKLARFKGCPGVCDVQAEPMPLEEIFCVLVGGEP